MRNKRFIAGSMLLLSLFAVWSIVQAIPTSPQNIEFVSQIDGLDIRGTAILGNHAYFAAVDDGLRVFNVTNPANPIQVGLYDTPGSALGITISGNYVYIADGSSGLRIINIVNPSAPVEIGFYDTPGYAWDVVVVGDYAYVADSYSGLRVINVSNPTNPTEVGFYDTPGEAWDIAVEGVYSYIADRDGFLRIIDISNPSAPVEAGFYNTSGLAWGVAVSGNHVFVAHSYGLSIVDVTTPQTPTLISSKDTGFSNGLTLAGNYVYVANGFGIEIVNVTNPAMPITVVSYETTGSARDAVVAGNYFYVDQLLSPLAILWFAPPASANIPLSGGTVTSPNDNTAYVFPSGTFTDTVVFTHTARLPSNASPFDDLIHINHIFDISATYSSTGQPAQPAPSKTYTVTVQYIDAEMGSAIENTLTLYYWDGSQWVKELSSTVDMVNNTVTATPNHFSQWAVLGETQRVFLPTILRN